MLTREVICSLAGIRAQIEWRGEYHGTPVSVTVNLDVVTNPETWVWAIRNTDPYRPVAFGRARDESTAIRQVFDRLRAERLNDDS